MSVETRTLRAPARSDLRDLLRGAGTLLGLVAIMATFSALSPAFLTQQNLINILQQSSINACVALGMTLVIISGGIDLSVGSVAALCAVVAASLMVGGTPVLLAALAGLALGAFCGLLNGLLIAFVGLQPFIVTLGTLSLYRAFALIYTDGSPVFGIPDAFRGFFTGSLGPVPMPVVVVAVSAFLAWLVLRQLPLGEYIVAVGGNEEAARASGAPVDRTKVVTYVISGVLASLAALILVGRLGAAEPILGNLWELNAIAAAAIGGASLSGGRGSLIGTLLGAIILGAMTNGLTLLNVQAFYQLLATGVIILLAMIVDRLAKA